MVSREPGDRGELEARELDAEEREAAVRAALEDMARTLHASYLQRWGRHDPAGLERLAGQAPAADRSISAA